MHRNSSAAADNQKPERKKRRQSPGASQAATDKSYKADVGLLTKCKQQQRIACPLVHQVNVSRADVDELHDGVGEQGPELLRAVSEAYESGRLVMNVLMRISSVRRALPPATKMFAHMESRQRRTASRRRGARGHLTR